MLCVGRPASSTVSVPWSVQYSGFRYSTSFPEKTGHTPLPGSVASSACKTAPGSSPASKQQFRICTSVGTGPDLTVILSMWKRIPSWTVGLRSNLTVYLISLRNLRSPCCFVIAAIMRSVLCCVESAMLKKNAETQIPPFLFSLRPSDTTMVHRVSAQLMRWTASTRANLNTGASAKVCFLPGVNLRPGSGIAEAVNS